MASISWSDLFCHKVKLSGFRQSAATRGPAIGCFAHQNKLVLLRHKQARTHTLTHVCTNLVSLERKGRHAAHTRGGVGVSSGTNVTTPSLKHNAKIQLRSFHDGERSLDFRSRRSFRFQPSDKPRVLKPILETEISDERS